MARQPGFYIYGQYSENDPNEGSYEEPDSNNGPGVEYPSDSYRGDENGPWYPTHKPPPPHLTKPGNNERCSDPSACDDKYPTRPPNTEEPSVPCDDCEHEYPTKPHTKPTYTTTTAEPEPEGNVE